MKILISLGLFIAPILYSGAFNVPSAWGDDLKVTLKHEVAGITPEMKILPYEKGTLLANSGSQSYSKKDSKAKISYQSTNLKAAREKKYANARFIIADLVPVGTVTNLFEDKLGTRGSDEIIAVSAKKTLFA